MIQLSTVIRFARSVRCATIITLSFAALALSGASVDLYGDDQAPALDQRGPSDALSAHVGAAPPIPTDDTQVELLGRVLGQVEATYGGQTIALPGATVSLKDSWGQVIGDSAQSDVEGHYEVPSHPPGAYQLCADAPGFTSTCVPEPVVIEDDTQYLAHNLTLQPAGTAIRGRVTLTDGSPCYQLTTAFDTLVSARVTVSNGQQSVSAVGNNRGEFVLADLPGPGPYTLSAKCSGGRSQPVTITPAHLSGKQAVEVTIANSPPILRAVYAQDASGKPLRSFSPGQTVQVVAEVSDPDGDQLSFQWTDGGRGLTSLNEQKVSWTLPEVEARSFLNVEVSDGKGGFAVQQFSVGTSNTGDRFIGSVADATGKPLPKAAVTVDGQAVTVDAEGNYQVAVPAGERHVLTVKHPGYAPVAQVFYGAAMGLKHWLKPATRLRVDPTQPIRVSKQGIELTIEPNQLVDANGHRSTGLLNLDLYRYDASKGELPGDPAGVTADRKATTFVATEAVSIELTDDKGTEYELMLGSSAQLTLPAPSTETRSLQPQAMVFARYDEGKGVWATRSEVTRALQHNFTSQVGHLSIWSVGQLAGETACAHVKVDPFQLDLPFNLRVTVLADGAGGAQEVRNHTITGSDTLIPLLPPRRTVAFDVTPLDAPGRSILRAPLFVTANTTSNPFPPFPYLACPNVNLGVKLLPAKEWLNRIPGSEVTANAYYNSIGARPAKDTFAKWRSLNGFTAADDQNAVVLYNPNELGLGRRLNCSEPSSALRRACYVTKYGEVGGSPVTAFDDTIHNLNPGDTVAMEADRPNFDQPPVVKY